MYRGYNKFVFRLLVVFGFVNQGNFHDVIDGFENGELHTRHMICDWLKRIKKFKLSNEAIAKTNYSNCPANSPSPHQFGKTFGHFIDKISNPCACLPSPRNICVCLEIIWFVDHCLFFQRDPFSFTNCCGWARDEREELKRNEMYREIKSNFEVFKKFINDVK